jgi:hypothetical protein
MGESFSNPFAVQTPEDVSAEDIASLFVDVFTDFPKILKPGHTFLDGHRGSGKSMMFRYLEPDCQFEVMKLALRDHAFLGVYVPVKKTDLNLVELARLEARHAELLLNEHLLTVHVASRIFAALRKAGIEDEGGSSSRETRGFYEDGFSSLLRAYGGNVEVPSVPNDATLSSLLESMQTVCDRLHREAVAYLKQLSFTRQLLPYGGVIVGYLDFLVPLVQQLRKLPFMPNGPVFLLIDDADNLSETQTTILNSWVSSRTSADISLKISTQLNYKTYRTAGGVRIEAPHDYSEVNISSVYTSSRDKYLQRVRAIVQKRFDLAQIDSTPDAFFPPDEKQEAEIAAIRAQIRADFDEKGRGFRPGDDVTRYARPTYIAGLRGTRKSGSTYSYAGFEQLVHLSSGVVRHFLEAASLMYSEMQGLHPEDEISQIDPEVQNKVSRDQANDFRYKEVEKLRQDESSEDLLKLQNLIDALGGAFGHILISERSERRVFSIAFSDLPDEEVSKILRLGVRCGYFHRSSIGNKEGTGRTPLYILSRRLAPVYTLDPTSFAGYKFVTNNAILEAIHQPKSLLRRLKEQGFDSAFTNTQANLFEEGKP